MKNCSIFSRISAFTFSLCIIAIFCVPNVSAQSVPLTIFGPKQYDKPKGSPVTYSGAFQAPLGTGTYTLWVQSGADGLNEVKNVSVTVNGVEIIDSGVLRGANPAMKVIPVRPDNTITVTLNGQGGNFVTVKVLCDGCSPLMIDSPADGALVNSLFTSVKGTITTSAPETGVKVNGVLAQVAGSTFVANHVPIAAGWNTLTAELVSPDGTRNQTSTQVYGQAATQYVSLSADAENGLAPLEVTLTADLHLVNSVASVSLTPAGPAAPTVATVSQTEYKAVMPMPGMYAYTLTVVDNQGNVVQDSVGLSVQSASVIDALLKGKWTNMQSALGAGNIETALSYFDSSAQSAYREQFTAFQPVLAEIVGGMGQIKLVSMVDGRAEYEIITMRNGVTQSFHLLFVKDADGLWKIKGF